MTDPLLDMAIHDLRSLVKTWRENRHELPVRQGYEVLWHKKNPSIWKVFTIDEIVTIYKHWKKNNLILTRETEKPYIGLKKFFERHPVIHEAFREACGYEQLRVVDRLSTLDDIKKRLSLKHFTSREGIIKCFNTLKLQGIWDDEIANLREECLNNFPIANPRRSFDRSKEALKLPDLIRDFNDKKSPYLKLKMDRKLSEQCGGHDMAEVYRKILRHSLQDTINRVDFAVIDDAAFITLFRFLKIDDYETCEEMLPALAKYLTKIRSGGRQRHLFFPELAS